MKNKCHICGKRFKEEFCLNKHIEVIHAPPKPKPPAVSTVVSTVSDTDSIPQTLHYTTSKNQTIRIQVGITQELRYHKFNRVHENH